MKFRSEKKLGAVRYWYTRRDRNGGLIRVAKQVHFYKVAYVKGNVRDHDHEVDEARWFPFETGLRVLNFGNERELMGRLNDPDEP